MSKRQHIGSHSNHAHPDDMMRPRRTGPRKNAVSVLPTSTQRRVEQRIANAKRRRRDKLVEVD